MIKFPFSYTLDHIGIAVPSLEEGGRLYQALGFKEVHIEEVVSEGVRVGTYGLSNGSKIELLEPLSEKSPVAKFLKKKGSGVHHIALGVENLAEVLKRLKAVGIRTVYDEPRPGAHNCLIGFIHPSAAGGVLIELSEKQS